MSVFHQLVGIVFLTTLVSSEYNPLKDPNICGLPTCAGAGKFKYTPDIQRNYKYSVEVRSLFNGTSKNESTLYVEGTATLAFLTPCDGLLTLADIKLSENIPRDGSESSEHANTQLFADMITEYSLRFSFKDGVISELCPREDEKEWVLNFKRGILSMLHNSMKRLDLDLSTEEVDVRGSCPTDYKVVGVKETSLLIEKNKDLDRCQGNSKLHSSIKSETMRMSRSNTNNILKSSSRCILTIDHNIYKEIKCEERYLLQPFSNFEEGAVTVVSQQLTLLDEIFVPMTDENEITKRVPLTFDHAISTKPTNDDLNAAKDLIKQLCKQNQMPDRMDMSDLFSKFIHNLRKLSYSALTTLHGQAGAICPVGNKHLLDALPYVRTSGSVALMRDIIVKKSIPKRTINEWIFSIGFIANPDEETMEAAWNLLEEKTFSPNAALSIASLTHTYCSQHSDCRSTNAVDSIVNHLENHFLQLYRSNNIDRNIHDQIMVTLKALSNTGVISEDFQQELFEVIENSNLDVAIRVAAVETFRRSFCEDTRSYFENRFRNQDEDVEVRIASYLQIMRCPNYLLIRTIRHSLMNEEVNQVGSFVWTHLKNLLTTANPSKVEVQSLLSDKDLVKKFDSDIRKFSRNYEGSIFFNEYDVGGNYESNVIFSPSSYIPKSAMLNLTFDLFGEAVNILEVYGRMDGLEHYLESFFGPKGTSETLKDNIMDKLRWPRSVRNNEIIKSQVEKLPNVLSNVHEEPKVALGFKIFGNDADYATFNGHSEIRAAIQTLDPVYHLKRILSGEEINYNKAAMFLDGKYVIPSGAGLPLSLTATGTASINIKLYGSLQAAGFSKDKELELDLSADIQPSVSVDLTGEMSVDAFYASTGIKLKTNMYTDSAIQGDVKVRGYKLASLKFSLPRKKNEIFVAKSEILVKRHDVEHLQKGMSSNRFSKSLCSWPIVDQTIGLKVCTEYSFMNVTKMTNIPYFLAAGPANFRCFLQKSDPTANNYSFEYKLTQRRDLSVVSLTFDTPGSTVNRLLSANLTIDRQSQNLTLFLQSSAGTVLARGKYKNTPDEKFLHVALDINNRKHFDATASLKRQHIRNGYSYIPNVYLGVNGERVFRISGKVNLMSKKGISQYSVDLKFETKRFISRLYGYISKSESSLEASLFNDYKFLHMKEQRVSIVFGAANRSHKNLVVFEGFSRLVSTAYPNMNFAANATFQNIGGHTDLTIKLHQNPLPNNHPEADFKTLKFELLLSSKVFTDNKRIFRAVSTLNRKSSNLDLKGEFIYETFRQNITTALLVKYGKNKEVSVTIFWSHPRTALEQIKTHVNVTIPSFTPMILKLEIVEKSRKDYMIDFSGTWFSGHRMSAFGFYQDRSTSLASDHHVKLLLRSPNFRDINIDLQFYRDNDILKLDLKGLHANRDEYEMYFIHQTVSEEETNNEIRIKYVNQLYRYVGSIYDGEYKKINADVHIDQIRDIVFSVYIYNKPDNKSLGFDINWDANRDPDQKLMIFANYEKYASFDYIANFIVSYPGRTIKGDYKFLLERRHLETLASVSWEDGKTLAIDMDILYEYDRRLYLEIDTQLNTPFDNWKILKLDGRFEHIQNKYDLRGMMSWDRRQRITVDLFGDYTSTDSYFTCKYSCSIVSTSDKLPNINTTISHTQNETNFDTNLQLMYNPEFIIGAESRWRIDSDLESTNLTGTLRSQTPFKGMKNTFLVGKVISKNRRYIKGAAQLDVDHKKIDLDMEGYFKKLTDCRLVINATTPEDKYQLRFIVSTEKRTLVAMVNYPMGSVGTEVILSMISITNFDIIFHLATPVSFLQEVLIVAKLKPEEADFRLGWNSLLLGLAGVWHYANVTDFEYSYKIYTPIDDFEENGIVGKFILKEGLDFEVSIKLSNYKLGAKLLGHPKAKPLKEMGIKLENIYKTSDFSGVEERDNEDPFSWEGLIELDIIIYPTMKGKLEIDQKGNSYILLSKLTMPNGVAIIVDEFVFTDILKMKNYLEITTPFSSFKTIESNFDLNIEAGRRYILGLNFDYQNQTELIKSREEG
nr:uncharacterized protein LOC111504019 [Leptinotarsa decemlineata]